MDLSIIIPCFNEVENIPKIRSEFWPVALELAGTRSVEVIFVDDGSKDGTGPALEKTFLNGTDSSVLVKIERHETNRGLGAAIRTGFAAAQGDVIITTDSDGTYHFTTIPSMLGYLTPQVDIITASPYHPDGNVVNVPAYRLVLSRGSSTIYRMLVDGKVHTYTCLYRAYRRQVIKNVPFASDGYLAGTELLVNGMLVGYRVAEFPAVLHSRLLGASKAKLARTVLAHLSFQARIVLHRLRLMPFVELREVVRGQEWA